MRVVEVLRGTKRPNLVLPYSCGFVFSDGPLIWPTSNEVGKKRVLCVVVPEGEDVSAPKIAGVDEAASKVIVVNNGAAIREMKAICRLYDSPITPKYINAVREAANSPLPTVRSFALELTIMKLGRTAPDEAIKIIQSQVAGWAKADGHEKIADDPLDRLASLSLQQNAAHADIIKCDELTSYIGEGFLKVGPEEKFSTFLCRCLVVFAQSKSSSIRENAIRMLANGISFYDYIPGLRFRPLDGLYASARKELDSALTAESSVADTNTLANIHLIQQRLSK
jgi:hypothetical protein